MSMGPCTCSCCESWRKYHGLTPFSALNKYCVWRLEKHDEAWYEYHKQCCKDIFTTEVKLEDMAHTKYCESCGKEIIVFGGDADA